MRDSSTLRSDHELIMAHATKPFKPEEEKQAFSELKYLQITLSNLRSSKRKDPEIFAQTMREYEQVRTRIVNANIALVVSVVRQAWGQEGTNSEIVVEAMPTLLSCVEKFKPDRGYKFSTYLTAALLKFLSRRAERNNKRNKRFWVNGEIVSKLLSQHSPGVDQDLRDALMDLESVLSVNLAGLNELEAFVVRLRFALGEKVKEPKTLEEIGEIIGVTKERVRQIQRHALWKLRISLTIRDVLKDPEVNLDNLERMILRMTMLEGKTSAQVGRELGIKPVRVDEIRVVSISLLAEHYGKLKPITNRRKKQKKKSNKQPSRI